MAATAFEATQTVARVYAEAVLALATERGAINEVEAELADLARLWRTDAAFSGLMTSAAIDDDARRESLRKIFRGRVHDLVLNLMLVLNDKGRSMLLPGVIEAFQQQLDVQRGRQRVFVTTAVPLTDDQRQRTLEQAGRFTRGQPVLVERIDENVLGGLIMRIGDHVIDTSLRLRLRHLRAELRRSTDRQVAAAGGRFVTE